MGFRGFWFGFDGRIGRARYWLALLTYCLAMFIFILAVASWLGDGRGRTSVVLGGFVQISGQPHYGLLSWFLTLLFNVPMVWSFAATSVKRFHDRNKSGWWLIPLAAVPLAFGQFGDMLDDGYFARALQLLTCALLLWLFVEGYCLRGTRGPIDTAPTHCPRPGVARSSPDQSWPGTRHP
ncbi:DUF805 domain-containing protein [Tardiphaga alba]|uniref:DUF805 domain-containing protein n=1 Tax=Tardiphaga alba TaxID=340268 RepID=A0ABX8A3M4_9BRAD|nr:DUF805 domain-containing protein [Tardiphaga alba]QUS38229.1 DUF805 domain-containing protein [Tardiphaga alba]